MRMKCCIFHYTLGQYAPLPENCDHSSSEGDALQGSAMHDPKKPAEREESKQPRADDGPSRLGPWERS